ncbi:MAG TPA: sulfatase [Thermoanaerobaculia bacterium]|nr:sulfatase [Thermoanaerobaculia bacterium]
MRSRFLAFGLAALLPLTLSCRGDRIADGPPRRQSVARWIEEEPAGSAPAIRVHDEIPRFRWSFLTPEDLSPWAPHNADQLYGLTPEGLALRSSTADPYLVRTVDFDAREVDILRIRQSALGGGAFAEVFWAAEGEAFVPERGMRVSVEDPGASPAARSYSIPVGNHPLWKGKIRYLRIDPVSSAGRVVVRSVEGLRRRLDPRRLAEAEARPWRVELDGDARAALLARPGRLWEREIEVPDGAELRFAYSLTATAGPPVTFRVTARNGGSEPRVLFEEAVRPEKEPRWREAKIPLAPLAGSRARLALETRAAGPFDPLKGFPVWAHPEVVAVRKGGDPRPNVVIVLVDTLRADHTSLYGYPKPTTPRLDAWAARRAVVFENAVAPAPWTLPSHVSLFSGLDAVTHGINYGQPAPDSLSLLAERLRREGYATAAFTGGAYLTPGYGLAQGFDRFHAHRESAHAVRSTGKDLDRGIERARAWIEESATEPFLLFLHTYEVHAPFSAREPYFSRFAGGSRRPGEAPPEVLYELVPPVAETSYRYEARFTELVRKPEPKVSPLPAERLPEVAALYDSGIAYADEKIGGFLDRLRSSGLEDRTAVVFTSDHGEGLGEHGSAGHGYLYEWNLLVPLAVALPGVRPEVRRVPAQVRLIDVMPTLLELAGLPSPPGIDGRSLLPLIENPQAPFPKEAYSSAASGNRGVSVRVLNRWKYIYQRSPWRPYHGDQELFDLRSDPGEAANLAEGDARQRTLRRNVEGHVLHSGNHVAVRVKNAGPEPLRVRLGGPLAHAFRVKAFELPCDCAVWEKGETVLTVPPGTAFPLYLEGPQDVDLEVSLAAGEATLSRALPVGRLPRPMRFVLLGGSWQTTSSPLPSGATGIEIERRGEAMGRAEDPAGSDEALREQLRGVGYVGR